MVTESRGQVDPTPQDIDSFVGKLTAWGATLTPGEQAAGQQLIAQLAAHASDSSGSEVQGYQLDVMVTRGDSLWSIAQQVYGDGRLWPLIWAANQGTIGGNPNMIFPGQVLRLPGT
jgi:nucleoid-associated protein YgaU